MAILRRALVTLVGLLVLVPSSGWPDPPPGAERPRVDSRGEVDPRRELEQSTRELIATAQAYRASLEALLPFHEAEVTRATETVARRRELFTRGIVARREVEDAERAREAAEAKLGTTRSEITQSETLVAEVVARDALRRVPASPTPAPRDAGVAGARFTYYNGLGTWSLAQASKIEQFFTTRFGRALPISAWGQTAVHDRLGFDHRDALDVAVHPDSAEGRALMTYLRSASISFIAFRGAVPGVATGAHIHIGPASQRLARSGHVDAVTGER